MDGLKVSSGKLEELKLRFIYFNHVQEIGEELEQVNWDMIPQEYRHFVEMNRPYDTLAFYNWYYGQYIFSLENKTVDTVIIDTLFTLEDNSLNDFQKKLKNNLNFWDRLLKRSSATYRIHLDRNKGDFVTQSLLHIYSSSYENTELLFYLYWFCQALIGEPLTDKFDAYKDSFGNIKKGLLINDILQKLSTDSLLKDFRSIVKNAYNKTLRHLSFHNSATLDDDLKLIINIDNPNIKISYADFFTSMYSLQQLQNHLKMYANVLLIDEQDILNEGFFSLITIESEETNKELALIQLDPFYSYDLSNNTNLNKITISKEHKNYIFYSEKEILRVERDNILDSTFASFEGKDVINVFCVQPDVFETKETDLVLNHDRFGDFIIVDSYTIDEITIKNID